MKITINDNIFNVKLAVTPKNIKNGMMKQRFNNNFNGMFFILDKNDTHCFWMYDCVIPLDIIFIGNDTITKIHHNCPVCRNENECESYCGNGNRVLEIAGGSCKKLDINEGDTISITLI